MDVLSGEIAGTNSRLERSYDALETGKLGLDVKEVEVTGNDVLLSYTMPLPPDDKSEEKMGVLYSVHHGGDRGIRTPGLCDANAALSQLSYIPTDIKL